MGASHAARTLLLRKNRKPLRADGGKMNLTENWPKSSGVRMLFFIRHRETGQNRQWIELIKQNLLETGKEMRLAQILVGQGSVQADLH